MSNHTTEHTSKKTRGRTRQPIEQRFWRYVDKTDSCWLWTGAKTHGGYGIIHGSGKDGGIIRAHRLSYELHYGPIPDGLDCCHRCDRPACVHPEHLFLGTAKENTADMIAKNRVSRTHNPKGERHPMSKLTESQVASIKAEYIPHVVSLNTLAQKYNVNKRTILFIIQGKHWKHD